MRPERKKAASVFLWDKEGRCPVEGYLLFLLVLSGEHERAQGRARAAAA